MNNSKKKFIIAVPGRLQSKRLPNKLLLEINGKSIITRVLEKCLKASNRNNIVFCTDDKKLILEADKLNIKSFITNKSCSSGSERIASIVKELVRIANNLPDEVKEIESNMIKNTLIVNVQGDQPFIDPNVIKKMIKYCFEKDNLPLLTTPIYKLNNKEIHDPNIVKTLINKKNKAIYFSRSAIPHLRGVKKEDWYKYYSYYGHVGIYGYRADILLNWFSLGSSDLEESEKLEQLKLIDSGYYYDTFLVEENNISIDTKKQYLEAIDHFKNTINKSN